MRKTCWYRWRGTHLADFLMLALMPFTKNCSRVMCGVVPNTASNTSKEKFSEIKMVSMDQIRYDLKLPFITMQILLWATQGAALKIGEILNQISTIPHTSAENGKIVAIDFGAGLSPAEIIWGQTVKKNLPASFSEFSETVDGDCSLKEVTCISFTRKE